MATPINAAPEAPKAGKLSLKEGVDVVSQIQELVSLISSGSSGSKILLSQLKRIVASKADSGCACYSSFLSETRNPLLRWISSSPTIMMSASALDKAVASGLVTDSMISEVLSTPEILTGLVEELTASLSTQ